MKRRWPVLCLAVLICLCPGLSGCSASKTDKGSDPGQNGQIHKQTEDMTEEMTESVTEAVTEAVTEEMEFRSIREVLGEDTLRWAETFNAAEVKKMIYTSCGEEKIEYVVTDPAQISAFYVALMDLTVAGLADNFIFDPGDTYDFYTKDGQVINFGFSMGSFLSEGKIYETDHSDRLWELTGELIPEEDL